MPQVRATLLLILTLLLSGRAMTLAFIHRAGAGGVGDPPAAWLMPLVGDAVIGVSALAIAYLIWKRAGLFGWTLVVVWNALALWDALSAYLIHLTVPWPSFFMIEAVGPSMFFMAAGMHALCLYLVSSGPMRAEFLGARLPA